MFQLNLTDLEASTLRDAIEMYISDLRMEIPDTDQKNFREDLKQKETVLKKILNALPANTQERHD